MQKEYGLIFDLDGVVATNEVVFYFHDQLKLISKIMHPSLKEKRALNVERLMVIFENLTKSKLSRKLSLVNAGYKLFLDGMKKTEGIETILEFFSKKCIASNSSVKNVLSLVRKLGLKKYFDESNILSGQDFDNLKPHPSLLIAASKALNLPVEQCILIDDSLDNLVAAKAQGFKTFGFLARYNEIQKKQIRKKMKLAGIDIISDNLSELLSFAKNQDILSSNFGEINLPITSDRVAVK